MAQKLLYIQLLLLGVWYMVPGWSTFDTRAYEVIVATMSWTEFPEIIYGAGFAVLGLLGLFAQHKHSSSFATAVFHVIPICLSAHVGMMAAARIQSGAIPLWVTILAMHVHWARQQSRHRRLGG